MRYRGKLGLAGRAGRWSAAHRKTAIWGWIAFVIAAIAVGGALGTKTLSDSQSGVGESKSADLTLEKGFPQGATEQVIFQSRGGESVHGPQVKKAVGAVEARLRKLPFVANLTGPFAKGADGQISGDGRSALLKFEIPERGGTEPDEVVGKALAQVAAVQKQRADLRVEEVGDASGEKAVSESLEEDFSKAELTSLPITLLILIVVFGSLLAAGVPLLLALTAVGATIGLLGPVSHLFGPVAEQIDSVILLIGLAVGVDYSIFYLRREREERAAGAGERASLEAAAATSGRAILVSGFTVMVAMAGMYIAGDPTFASFATGTIIVVAVAMVGSLTVLPALLAWLGDRIEKGRIPFLGQRRGGADGSRVWSALVNRVMHRPKLAAGIAVAGLVICALPAFGLKTANSGTSGLPKDMPIVQTLDRVEAAFPGGVEPAHVAISAPDVKSPEMADAVHALRERIAADPHDFGRLQSYRVAKDGSVAELSVPLAGDGTDSRSEGALAKLRDELIPATVGAVPGARAQVAGSTASSVDFNDLLGERVPWVFAFVLGMAFLLLLVSFRSLVIPLTAIGLNLLSVGAAYGVVVWIFQDGHLEGLLGFHSVGTITAWLPLFLFVVLFGLSMDYHVFILTRIREAYDRGMSTEAAVSHGLRTTAGVVTSAAAVMVAVFAIFATLSFLDFKEMGVGLAAAILIDATVIRGVLLPATMKLLGERNWYLPRWLEWLPQVELEGALQGAPEGATSGAACGVRTSPAYVRESANARGAAPGNAPGSAPEGADGESRDRPTGRAAEEGARLTRLLSMAPPWAVALWRLVPRVPAQIGGGISLLTFVIWGLTGAGTPWFLWVWLSVWLILALVVAWRWSRLAPPGPRRSLETQGAFSIVLVVYTAFNWAISERGYFWPVWVLLGAAIAFAVHLMYLRNRGADLRPARERELTERVETLTETRRGALDVQAAELRRIERDLHDGAQARLVALSMQLGRAEEGLADRPEIAALVRQARAEATAANAELRDLARGIAPPVLTDRGLAAAVEALGSRSPVPVTVDAQLGRRPAPVIESAAYFVVAESLTNVAKHAPEARASVKIRLDRDELDVVVADDGPGGADLAAGSGLDGLRRRVAALDGDLEVASPLGEGTRIEVRLPCGS